MSGFDVDFFTVTPKFRTSVGRLASAWLTRFCTSTLSMSMPVSTAKETRKVMVPSLAFTERR